jgi:dTMP kinase
MERGKFITFDGPEGSGKSTQVKILKWRLKHAIEEKFGPGSTRDTFIPEVIDVRGPGTTALGESLRSILMDPSSEISDMAELLMFGACTSQLIDEVILPALEKGSYILCDRFTDSTEAYQGYARGDNLVNVVEVNRLATRGLMPNLSFLIDVPVEVGSKRALERGSADRFQKEDLDFHHKVREGYLEVYKYARSEGYRYVIDGQGTEEEVSEQLWKIVSTRFGF